MKMEYKISHGVTMLVLLGFVFMIGMSVGYDDGYNDGAHDTQDECWETQKDMIKTQIKLTDNLIKNVSIIVGLCDDDNKQLQTQLNKYKEEGILLG